MNISTYNQSLNQAMPWTSKLQDIDVKELESIEEKRIEEEMAIEEKKFNGCDTYEEYYG